MSSTTMLSRLFTVILCLSGAFVVNGVSNAAMPGSPYAWYKADAGVSDDGNGGVTAWGDQVASGQALDRVIGTPEIRTLGRSGGGSAQVLAFNGSSALWAAVGDWGSVTGNRTVVVRARLSGTADGFLFDGSTHSGKTRAQVRNGQWQAGVKGTGDAFGSADTDTTAITANAWQTHIFTYTESGGLTQVSHYIDGNQAGSLSVASVDTSLGGLILAAHGGASGWLACEIAEVIVYARALDAVERAAGSYATTRTPARRASWTGRAPPTSPACSAGST